MPCVHQGRIYMLMVAMKMESLPLAHVSTVIAEEKGFSKRGGPVCGRIFEQKSGLQSRLCFLETWSPQVPHGCPWNVLPCFPGLVDILPSISPYFPVLSYSPAHSHFQLPFSLQPGDLLSSSFFLQGPQPLSFLLPRIISWPSISLQV